MLPVKRLPLAPEFMRQDGAPTCHDKRKATQCSVAYADLTSQHCSPKRKSNTSAVRSPAQSKVLCCAVYSELGTGRTCAWFSAESLTEKRCGHVHRLLCVRVSSPIRLKIPYRVFNGVHCMHSIQASRAHLRPVLNCLIICDSARRICARSARVTGAQGRWIGHSEDQ